MDFFKWLDAKGQSKGEENMNGRNLFQCIEDARDREFAIRMYCKGFPIAEIADCTENPVKRVVQWISESMKQKS